MPALPLRYLVRAALLFAFTLLLAPFVFASVPAARGPDLAPTAPATSAFGALQTPTVTGTGSITPPPSDTPTATATPGATETATFTPTPQPPATETATATATATASRTPTATPTLGFMPRAYLPLIRYEYVPPPTPTPTITPSPTVVPRCLVTDGGFEAGAPNPYWDEYSTNFGTPLCTVALCGYGTGTGPHSGAWWAWFGGTTAFEQGYLRQTVTIPPSTATLSYWLEIPVALGQGGDYLEVRIDGALIVRYTVASQPNFLRYALVQHNVSQYANGGPHQISFESTTYGGPGQVTNFFVDDVNLCIR
jgi:hypothetical protein